MNRRTRALAAVVLISVAACRDGTGPTPTLVPLWKTTLPIPPEQYWLGKPAADAQRVIVEGGNLLFSLDAATGAIQWQHRVRIAPAPAPTVPVIDAGRVFLAEVDSTFALDAATGATLWTFHPDSQGVVVPAVDGTSVYIGQRGIPTLYALDKASGAVRWRQTIGGSFPNTTSVRGLAVRGDTLYATVWRFKDQYGSISSGILVALDVSDGRELWRFETSGDHGSFPFEPLLVGGMVVVINHAGGSVLGVDLATQAVRWSSSANIAVLATDGETLYGAGSSGDAYALSVADATVRWVTALGSSAEGIAVCAGSVWEDNGNLHRVDPATGAETGRFGTRGLDIFVSDIGTANDRVFLAGGPYVSAFDCR